MTLVIVTAWRWLLDVAGLRPTDRCQAHGSTGDDGHVAVQLATHLGVHTVTTGASDRLKVAHGFSVVAAVTNDRGDLRNALFAKPPKNNGAAYVILDSLRVTTREAVADRVTEAREDVQSDSGGGDVGTTAFGPTGSPRKAEHLCRRDQRADGLVVTDADAAEHRSLAGDLTVAGTAPCASCGAVTRRRHGRGTPRASTPARWGNLPPSRRPTVQCVCFRNPAVSVWRVDRRRSSVREMDLRPRRGEHLAPLEGGLRRDVLA